MTPTLEQIQTAMANAIGNPSSGILRDALPTLAAAAHATINPNTNEQRIITATETRTTTPDHDPTPMP